MGRRSRKRSFPHWEKKHRERAEKLRARVMGIYANAILAVVKRPNPLFSGTEPFTGRTVKFAVGREVTHGR